MQYKGKEVVKSAVFSVPVNVKSYNFSLGGVEEKAMCLNTGVVNDGGEYSFDTENSNGCYIKIGDNIYFQEEKEEIRNPIFWIHTAAWRRQNPKVEPFLRTNVLCGKLRPKFSENYTNISIGESVELTYTKYPQGETVGIEIEDSSICDIVSDSSTADRNCILITGKTAGITYATITFHPYKGYEGLTREIAVKVS